MEKGYFTKFTKIIFFACYEDIFNAAKWRDVALLKGGLFVDRVFPESSALH